jgi:hypothetical protein
MTYLITWVISGVCGVLAVWSFGVHAMYVDLKFEIGSRTLHLDPVAVSKCRRN